MAQLFATGIYTTIWTLPNHHPRTIDRHLYKERHLIETFFNKIKEYRKIATRYDKLAEVFAAFVCLAASLIWLR